MITEVLHTIQQQLKAPKGQFNEFGKYRYRSCEDILEAVKPLLAEHKAALTINDEVVSVGNRIYVMATATLAVGENTVCVSAYAREPENKKGMDEAQITGATSSYARKYALNGLFAIDDTKDADATNKHGQESKPVKPAQKAKDEKPITKEQQSTIMDMVAEAGVEVDKILAFCGCKTFETIPATMFDTVMNKLQITIDANKAKEEKEKAA